MRARCGHFGAGGRWAAWLLACLLAAGVTAGVMRTSMARGRLAADVYPRVDDVIYMARGAELWRAGKEGWDRSGLAGGVRGVLRDWRRDPPHAPWASGCAAMGYAVAGGVRDWAAYAFTGVPVLAFLLAAGRIGRRAGGRYGWKNWGLVVFAAGAPLLGASVQNLKPDYCAGICSAIGMMILLRGPVLTARWQRLAWVGIWLGLALLAKPAMLIATVLLAAGSLAACVLRDVLVLRSAADNTETRWGWMVMRAMRGTAIIAGVAGAIALPHYWFALEHVWVYSTGILAGGDGDAWAYQGSPGERLLFYLTGPGGRLMLGGARTVYVLLGVLAGVVWCAWTARRRGKSGRRMWYLLTTLAVLGMAWAGPTAARVLISQFAAAFSALLWLAAAHAVSWLVGRREKKRIVCAAIGWGVVIALTATWRPSFPMLPKDPAHPRRVEWRARTEVVRGVYAAMRKASAEVRTSEPHAGAPDELKVLLAGSPSDLGTPLVTLWSVRDGERWDVSEARRMPTASPEGKTPEAAGRARLEQHEIVVVYEPGVSILRPKEATEGADAFYLRLIRANERLRLVERVSDPASGSHVEVYRRAGPGK